MVEISITSTSNNKEQFIHMNVHYNVDKITAVEQALVVNKTIKRLMEEYPDVPIFITGDYNATVNESGFKVMMRGIENTVQSGAYVIKNEDSKIYTFHTIGDLTIREYSTNDKTRRGPIDHVCITTNLLNVNTYKVIKDPFACWGLDHYPIFVDVDKN